jgi:hypothetical protein
VRVAQVETTVTLEELLVSSLAQTDALAKLLTERLGPMLKIQNHISVVLVALFLIVADEAYGTDPWRIETDQNGKSVLRVIDQAV